MSNFTTTTPKMPAEKITADSPSKLPDKNSSAPVIPTTPAARIQSETPGEMVPARPIKHSTEATEQPTAAPKPSTLRLLIRYDPWIVDTILQLANPDVGSRHSDLFPNPMLYLDVTTRSISYKTFQDKVFKLLKTVPADHDVAGIIKYEMKLGHLVWVGRITTRSPYGPVYFYPFPAKYAAFRRKLLNAKKGFVGDVRIKHTEEYYESYARSRPHHTDNELTDDDQAIAERIQATDTETEGEAEANFIHTTHTDICATNEEAINDESAASDHQPPAKRQRLYSASVDISMFEFFFICHLRPDDEHTVSVIDNNDFYHWSAFKGMTEADLVKAGFRRGAARLIVAGVVATVRQVEERFGPAV
ncbi:hypothetical protein PGT21_028958 [Puccinia graminis f. sp. tritici]|uniref:Uncharacterized protein n=2 Tax=Puccinia graminis f. sp. tritici TaxID=56615 RepID=E3KIS0_PUCGT|nr:uncharacterized protein PGTG_10573 [Puccinia graminis f. sp. tritici CRL 75-36-700-3]XP_003337999.2 uncharacterized protein PGTG_19633 [Puccinia graminis f. sp. tritici CRL 75-36-700-3]KAA1074818.1 hypothetical protein PGT21_021871 [Puccinia graminis f. sp. tritici]EFP84195.2 hypothetical protein PGTG_10573 [Puccinia graminis f. sp. tritici CRL 75-36-700-3]EFP93580.2 hypothetical protein PGTG_19633 [Puccinia graminis f. sp. tritici CRL 75-36-700-3]KAA1074937.1 hypothetical protein PGT21_025